MTDPLLEIVGVARDSKYVLVFEAPRPYIYLRAVGGSRLDWLASAVTGADGRFRARGAVPRTTPGGTHRIIVRVRGDDRRAPSR